MLFLPVKRSAGSQGFFQKNTTPRGVEIFFKKPVGLDLDGQAHRANFAFFF